MTSTVVGWSATSVWAVSGENVGGGVEDGHTPTAEIIGSVVGSGPEGPVHVNRETGPKWGIDR